MCTFEHLSPTLTNSFAFDTLYPCLAVLQGQCKNLTFVSIYVPEKALGDVKTNEQRETSGVICKIIWRKFCGVILRGLEAARFWPLGLPRERSVPRPGSETFLGQWGSVEVRLAEQRGVFAASAGTSG